MKNYLLIDVNSIFHRSYSSLSIRMPNAKDIHGNITVGTFGFFTTLFKTLNIKELAVNTPELVFAYDCKNSTATRKTLNPDYKANRKPKPSEFYKDLDTLLRTYIPMLGVLPLAKQGYEADDIIASACRYISSVVEEESSIHILSGDGDLEQCAKYANDLLSIHWIKTQPKWVVWISTDVLDKWGLMTLKTLLL